MAKEYIVKSDKKGVNLFEEENITEVQNNPTLIERRKTIAIDISLRTIITILLIMGGIYLGSKLIAVLVLLLFAFIVSSAALPSVRWLQERGVSKGLAIATVYTVGIIIGLAVISLIVMPFISQSQKLVSDIPTFLNNLVNWVKGLRINGVSLNTERLEGYVNNLTSWVGNLASSSTGDGFKTVFSAIGNVAGAVISMVTAVLISIYMVYDHDNFVDILLLRIFNESQRIRVRKLVLDVETKLGNWLIGQVTLCFIIGLMSWILLTILKVPFALPLAVMAGFLESIPSLGPTISVIPAALVAILTTNPLTTLLVLIGYIVIQQLEGTLIVPRVMANAVGLKPIIVIVAVTCGFTLGGPIGALLAVPIAVLIEIGVTFYRDLQKLQAKGIV